MGAVPEPGALRGELMAAAETVWDYHHVGHELEGVYDGVMCLCSHDVRVAEYAARVFLRPELGAKWLLFSGGMGTGPHSGANLMGWDKPEAAVFADAAVKCGVPADSIIVEDQAANTGENVAKSRELLQRRSCAASRIVLVQKPFMERRTFATFKKVWPEPSVSVTSPPISWEDYPAGSGVTRETIVSIMVGDLQRIRLYSQPPREFQIPQDVPDRVWAAYERLVEAGFTWNLVK
eukprot:TRINITY_DN11662_c0_g1_i1.p1 TRINITY_DN11662_c0_g1~~TRINITY_DN11662_c0_g1_i1.p1  ORF type:complete len:254 (+),score=78.43 TRINITY_DN11662_c0_g1_i1:59-763(+)